MHPHFNLSRKLFGQSTADDENGRGPSRPFILGAMSVYNEEEIIDQTITHMQSHRVPLVVIDNGSTDDTFGILKKYPKDVIVEISRIKTKHFTLGFLLRTLHNMISKYQPEWMLLLDADEFLEAPARSMSVREAIALESSRGFNLIQFDNFEFWPTEKDKDSNDKDIRRRIRHYSWNDNWQFKCFRNYPGTNIELSGGHLPIFPRGIRVNLSPNRFVKRHYMILSYKHGMRKVHEERLPRYSEDEKKRWGLHKYSRFGREEEYFVIDSSRLTEYHEDGKWVLERKFDGHRGYEFPNLRTSEEIEIEMEKYRKLIEAAK